MAVFVNGHNKKQFHLEIKADKLEDLVRALGTLTAEYNTTGNIASQGYSVSNSVGPMWSINNIPASGFSLSFYCPPPEPLSDEEVRKLRVILEKQKDQK